MTTQEQQTLIVITEQTEQIVLNALATANSVLAELDGPTTTADAERARGTGLIADAEALKQHASDLSTAVGHIHNRIGTASPPPPSPADGR